MRPAETQADAPASIADEDSFIESEAYWGAHLHPKPPVLTLTCDSADLSVKGGCLRVHEAGKVVIYEPASKTPLAIVFAGWGGNISVPAVRFCVEHKIALIYLTWMHGLMTFVAPQPKMAAALLRAQALADPLPIAKALIKKKVEHSHHVGCLKAGELRAFVAALRPASTLAEVRNIEAHAATLAWDCRQVELKPRGRHVLPVQWRRWTQRVSPLNPGSPRRATHPINAMINISNALLAGRLGAQLAARGASPALGFLHMDKQGSVSRPSLVLDAMEPLRPLQEQRLFKFISQRGFARSDFLRLSSGEVRIVPNLIKTLLQETALPEKDIQGAADFMVALINSSP
jgi:CRISPR-associated protein Cas1